MKLGSALLDFIKFGDLFFRFFEHDSGDGVLNALDGATTIGMTVRYLLDYPRCSRLGTRFDNFCFAQLFLQLLDFGSVHQSRRLCAFALHGPLLDRDALLTLKLCDAILHRFFIWDQLFDSLVLFHGFFQRRISVCAILDAFC